MKTMKKIIYTLLGLLLTGVIAMVGVILFAEYSGKRFQPDPRENISEIAFIGDESRLVYDENGNLAELPGVVPSEENTADGTEAASQTDETPAAFASSAVQEPAADASKETFIMDKGSAIFHKESCPNLISILEENKLSMTGTRDDVIARGYISCTTCNP